MDAGDFLGFLLLAAAVWFVVKTPSQTASQQSQDASSSTPPIAPEADPMAPMQNTSGNDALDQILQAVFHMEGGNPGNLNVRNNNPGNLRSGKRQIGTNDGFAVYATMEDGYADLADWFRSHAAAHPDWNFYDLFAYYLRGTTTGPYQDAQGDSNSYAKYVASAAGVDPNSTLSSVLGG
jgi:hypothetical protein